MTKANPMNPVENLSDDEFAARVHRAVRALRDAPAAWQQTSISLWATSPLAGGSTLSEVAQTAQALGRLVRAALTFDSWATPGLAQGMRSMRAPTRHLLYSTQGRDIDLRITPSAEHFALSGQILGPDESGQIELSSLDAAATVHRGSLDSLGEFRLDGVAAGRYALTLHLGSDPIVVEPIEVGQAAA
jgi:hypothetical protein